MSNFRIISKLALVNVQPLRSRSATETNYTVSQINTQSCECHIIIQAAIIVHSGELLLLLADRPGYPLHCY